jgi:oligoendopeptidase F
VRSIFSNADLRFGKIRDSEGKLVELTDTNYVPFLMGKDRRVRQSAFRALYKTYGQFKNTYSTLYNARIKESTTLARIRGFKDSITASTFSDEVTPVIYNNLIKSVNAGLPVIYDYYELKREVLGLDKLHLYDVYSPIIGAVDAKYSYEEAVEEVLKTTEIYGDEYQSTLSDGLKKLGCHRADACIIGDRMDTDIVAGIESELDTILVLSGVSSEETIKNFPYRPRFILENVGEIAK